MRRSRLPGYRSAPCSPSRMPPCNVSNHESPPDMATRAPSSRCAATSTGIACVKTFPTGAASMVRLATRGSVSIHLCPAGGIDSMGNAFHDSVVLISIGMGMGHNIFSLAAASVAGCAEDEPANSTKLRISLVFSDFVTRSNTTWPDFARRPAKSKRSAHGSLMPMAAKGFGVAITNTLSFCASRPRVAAKRAFSAGSGSCALRSSGGITIHTRLPACISGRAPLEGFHS